MLEVHDDTEEITTDRAPTLAAVIAELLPAAVHDTERYANNRIEADHGRLKARLRPIRGLKTLGQRQPSPKGTPSCRTFDAATTNSEYTPDRTSTSRRGRLRRAFPDDLTSSGNPQCVNRTANATEPFRAPTRSLRNPAGHREVNYDDVTEAAEAVAAASLLMRILDRVQRRLAGQRSS